MKRIAHLVVNGEPVEVAVAPRTTLLEALRYGLGLTGSKQGCDKGDCGACTVHLDGTAVLACLTLALDAEGRAIRTIEGLSNGGVLDPLQDELDRCGALQCGFCQPGMIMSARALLDRAPQATDEEIRVALSGNLCRCTGYTKIIEAVLAARGRTAPERGPGLTAVRGSREEP